MFRRRLAAVFFAGAAAACGDRTEPTLAVRTFALPAPAGGEPAREPHLAIDPNNPDRIIVAAQYGEGYNRGGVGIWSWVSTDGGRVWEGRNIPVPRAEATIAADAVTGFGTDGRGLLLFVYADSLFRGGAALTRTGAGDVDFGPASIAVRGELEADGAVDKPWLALDRNRLSPFRGSIYLSYHHIRPAADRTALPSLWIRRRSPADSTWAEPLRVSEHFGGQLAVRESGALDVVFLSTDERAVQRSSSADGGRSYGLPDTVAILPSVSTTRIETATLAPLPGDSLLACWSVDGPDDAEGVGTRCSTAAGTGGWARPFPVRAGGLDLWFPAVAGSGTTIWLAGYTTDSATIRLELLRSGDGGRSFESYRTLASRAFGSAGFCRAPGAACRKDSTRFFPGDYFGLVATSTRVGVAFAMPATDEPTGKPTVHISLIRPE